MTAAPSLAAEEARAHAWIDRGDEPNSYWVHRDCPACGLEDMKLRKPIHDNFHRNDWEVKTPCIEPVPERMSFEDFAADLAAHGINIASERRYELIPHAMGYPGKWRVGFKSYLEREEQRLDPAIPIEAPLELDHGWALLLRWLRARQYDPRKHGTYKSTNVHGMTLQHARDFCDDD